MGSSFRLLALLSLSALMTACSSSRELAGDFGHSQEKISALFSEVRITARCYSIVEAQPNQFVSVDLASSEGTKAIWTLEDCAKISQESRAEIGHVYSEITRVAANGIAPADRFEFNPSSWPVEYHFNNKIYHIFQGKVLSVE
jgi:hypothetical protein